jgi:hypothetical protein
MLAGILAGVGLGAGDARQWQGGIRVERAWRVILRGGGEIYLKKI